MLNLEHIITHASHYIAGARRVKIEEGKKDFLHKSKVIVEYNMQHKDEFDLKIKVEGLYWPISKLRDMDKTSILPLQNIHFLLDPYRVDTQS